jgi:hypothetical protein
MASLRLASPVSPDPSAERHGAGWYATFRRRRRFAAIVCSHDGSAPMCFGCVLSAVADWRAR